MNFVHGLREPHRAPAVPVNNHHYRRDGRFVNSLV